MESPFHTHGPLPPSASTYVRRVCDDEIQRFLQYSPLISIWGDFQVGKTSLMLRAHGQLQGNWKIFYQDIAGLRTDIRDLFLTQFFQALSKWSKETIDSSTALIDYLRREPSILLLDEIGALASSPNILFNLLHNLHASIAISLITFVLSLHHATLFQC